MTGAPCNFDAQSTYSAAAATYEEASRQFWQFLSPRTVDRLDLKAGDSVLDIACGTAPGTIAAARAVGHSGRVVGVDYADGMVAIAREKVRESGLEHVELVQADVTKLSYQPGEFDAVMCVLGIFFLEDMPGLAAQMWSYVRPGGRLAVTTLGTDVWTPMIDEFVAEAKRQQPGIDVVQPWRRTEDPETLRKVLQDGGVTGVRVSTELNELPFAVDDWWTIVMGSGLRSTAERLGDAAGRVRAANEAWARANSINTVRVAGNYALATKATD